MTNSTADPPIYIVLNPVAGTTDPAQVRALLEERFAAHGRAYELYETTGDEDLAALVRDAYHRGLRSFAAAGGDGTISLVADGLARSDACLAILPIGTANVLAAELGIPGDIGAAIDLLLDAPACLAIDAMRIGERYYLLHVGVGITSLMHRDTGREAKRRFGRLAYVVTFLRWLLDFQPTRFMLVIDGVRRRHNASMVMLANGATLGTQPFRWAETTDPRDGRIDVCVLHARSFRDYLAFAWAALTSRQRHQERYKVFPAWRSISINSRRPLPVQADGEIIGDTPVQITVVPGALKVVVPRG